MFSPRVVISLYATVAKYYARCTEEFEALLQPCAMCVCFVVWWYQINIFRALCIPGI